MAYGVFVEFANGSRVNSGYRLLKRCLRHSLDPRTPSIMNRRASLFVHKEDGEVGFVLENDISASMKESQYHVVTALTRGAEVNIFKFIFM